MQEWLPKLVGIERSLVLRLADGSEVRSVAEAAHASQLTRETVTAAVHFVQFALHRRPRSSRSGPVVRSNWPSITRHISEAVVLRDLTVT